MQSDTAQRIQDARKAAAQMTDELSKIKDEINDGTFKNFTQDVQVKSTLTLKLRRNLKGHLAKIYSMHWATDNVHLVSASQDGKLLVWEAMGSNKIHSIPMKTSWVMTCAYSPSGDFVACGGLDNVCSIYCLRSNNVPIRATRELTAHQGYLSCCRFFDDKNILTSSGDMTCLLWDAETGSRLTEFKDHEGDVMSVAVVAGDKNYFISGACDSTAKYWDVRQGKCVQTFKGHTNDINAVQFFPNANAFGTGSDDGSCKLFDIRSDRELNTYATESAKCGITSVAFSKSGRYLFAGYDNHECMAWDTLKGDKVATLKGHSDRVSCLGVTSDGYALCTGSWDNTLRVWA
eukprot:TRINITY_DN14907_c0_g1_i1.p1 TRINITY_DN14907_c0_g1~~TRINITY_DN14907_c0_g1_i1.p1  ORF type:complete len:347 (+),score=61.66 TRINITY_DN14907_c0_g1_i1:22-1062(+)